MRLSTTASFATALVLLPFPRVILAQASSAPTLSIFQPINGFSDACTKAYNTPLTDCSNADFSGRGCSAKCIGFLDNLTNLLTTTCFGTSAYPNTLIGLFLNGDGVHTICSNAKGSASASNSGNGNGQGGQSGAPPVQSTGIEVSASTTTTSTTTSTSIIPSSSTSPTTSTSIIPSSNTSPTTSSTPIAASTFSTTTVVPTTSSTAQAAATTSTTTIVSTTIPPEPTTTSIAVVETTVVPASPSDSSTDTSSTKSSTSSSSTSTSTGNAGNDNGGGTPLDIGSSACHDAAVSVWLFALLAGLAGVTWLL